MNPVATFSHPAGQSHLYGLAAVDSNGDSVAFQGNVSYTSDTPAVATATAKPCRFSTNASDRGLLDARDREYYVFGSRHARQRIQRRVSSGRDNGTGRFFQGHRTDINIRFALHWSCSAGEGSMNNRLIMPPSEGDTVMFCGHADVSEFHIDISAVT